MQNVGKFHSLGECSNVVPSQAYSLLASPLVIDPFSSQAASNGSGYTLVFIEPRAPVSDSEVLMAAFVAKWAGSEIDLDEKLEAASIENLLDSSDEE